MNKKIFTLLILLLLLPVTALAAGEIELYVTFCAIFLSNIDSIVQSIRVIDPSP